MNLNKNVLLLSLIIHETESKTRNKPAVGLIRKKCHPENKNFEKINLLYILVILAFKYPLINFHYSIIP